MFGKFSEQVKKSAQPAASLFEMNIKTLELLSKQHTMFVSGVITDSVKLLSSLAEQTEVNGVVAAQSMYAESVRERLTSTSKATYSELNGLRTNATDVVKNSLESANEQAKAAMVPVQTAKPVQKASVKTAPAAKKTAVANKAAVKKAPVAKKEAPVTKQAPAVKTAPTKVESAPEAKTVAPAAKKSVTKKAVAKPKAKAVKTEKPAAAKTAAATPAAKPAATSDKPAAKEVANLSPADVKAADKN